MRILVPISSPDDAHHLLPFLLFWKGEEPLLIRFLLVIERKKIDQMSRVALDLRRKRALLHQKISRFSLPENTSCECVVKVSKNAYEEVHHHAQEMNADFLLLIWKLRRKKTRNFYSRIIDQLMENPPCDAGVVRFPLSSPLLQKKCRILLPVRGGPYAELALKIAVQIANTCDGEVTLLHKIPETEPAYDLEADRPYAMVLDSALKSPRVTQFLTTSGNLVEEVLRAAKSHHIIVMGARGPNSALSTGVRARKIAESSGRITLIVRTVRPLEPFFFSPLPALPKESYIEKWFAENTFHFREFRDLKKLVERKKVLGLTISLGLPALNEESTLANILDTLKPVLMDEYPLLDEIVVIDSGSKDKTVEIARSRKIPVFQHPKILRKYGTFQGKGEALWKSLHILKGDLIAWMDTDIKNPHPKFVYGVLGPLLYYSRVGYVKGYFRRPLILDGVVHSTGGGRVTELVVRPLLNLFYPELSGIIQPLSGIYAGRRNILEHLSFYTCYGVEIGHLLDILEEFGLFSVAQVDVQMVRHRHQSLSSLSRMSFALQQIILKRAEEKKKLYLLDTASTVLRRIIYEPQKLHLETQVVEEHRRPPIISIQEYLQRR